MSIHFQCPHCQYVTTVPEAFAGHHQRCAQCGEQVQIPASAHYGAGARRRFPWIGLMVIVAILAAAALLLPLVSRPDIGSRRSQCKQRMREISYALLTYEIEHGQLPPAYTVDAQGNPLHSWRTLLLPQLGEKALFEKVNFEVPWDAPENEEARSEVLRFLHCPHTESPSDSNYMVVIGEDCLFRPNREPVSIDDIPDGAANTIMLVEVKDSGTHWMEPVDLRYDEMSMVVNSKQGRGISSRHEGGAHVAFANGEVHFLRRGLTTWTMRNLLQRNDGNGVKRDELN